MRRVILTLDVLAIGALLGLPFVQITSDEYEGAS